MRRITAAEWRTVPWDNGGGITHEIVRWPAAGVYDVRVSLAEVTADGPFSLFPGYRRWSFLAGPAPLDLTSTTTFQLTVIGDHLEVPGEIAMTAVLPAGATRLFNVIAREGTVVGHGRTAHPVRFVFALRATPLLDAHEAVVFDAPASFDTHDCVWIA